MKRVWHLVNWLHSKSGRLRRMRAGLVALVLAMFLVPVSAHAHPELDAARQAYERGDMSKALVLLRQAEADPNLTPDELVQLFWLRGACHHAVGETPEAVAAFQRLLQMRPLYTPSELEAPPDLMATFQKAASEYSGAHGVSFGPPTLVDGKLRVDVTRNQARVAAVSVFARAAGQIPFRRFELPFDGTRASGPLRDPLLWEQAKTALAVEIIIEGRDRSGVPVARIGETAQPISLTLTEPARARAHAAASATTEGSTESTWRRPTIVAGGVLAALVVPALLVAGVSFALSAAASAQWRMEGGGLPGQPIPAGVDPTTMYVAIGAGGLGLLAALAAALVAAAGISLLIVAIVAG